MSEEAAEYHTGPPKGMNIEEIKNRANRQPFRSFVIKLENGDLVPVTSNSELLFPHTQPDLVIAFTNGGHWTFEAKAVSAILE
jgi:hypothetical protein